MFVFYYKIWRNCRRWEFHDGSEMEKTAWADAGETIFHIFLSVHATRHHFTTSRLPQVFNLFCKIIAQKQRHRLSSPTFPTWLHILQNFLECTSPPQIFFGHLAA